MSEELKNYDESAIETLDWYTHIRTRPGMYIGSTGDGQHRGRLDAGRRPVCAGQGSD